LRTPLLLACASALALAGCGDDRPAGNEPQAPAEARPIEWSQGLEQQLMQALDDAPRHGLTRDLFLKGDLPGSGADRNRELTRIAFDYASALAHGKVDPAKLREVYTVPRPNIDVRAGLRQAAAEGRLREWLDSLAPQTQEYRALSEAFMQLVPLLATPAAVAADNSSNVSGARADEARDRARALAVAMERLRWLDRNPPATRIDVNTAATFLTYYRDGQAVDQRRVVAGQPGWETPQLGSPIFQLVANPSWTVPESIEEEELSKKPASYFREQKIVRKDGRYVQLPGPKNALGEVKFDMRNNEQIFLHDTPAKALFSQPERHESHGCVRVENAVDFARMLAEADGVLEEFDKALASGDEEYVMLKREVPVRLMYHTAYLGADGRVHFVPDVYGWDNDVAAALGYETKAPPRTEHRQGDIGP